MKLGIIGTGKIVVDALYAMEPLSEISLNAIFARTHSKDKYAEILEKYNDIRKMIEEKSHAEGDNMIICYTQIITDVPGFHKELENYEIYNGRCSFDEFKRIIFE